MKKTSIKRTSGLVMALLFLGSLAACGGPEQINSVDESKPSIRVEYYQGGYGTEYMKEIQKKFNARANNGEYDFNVKIYPDRDLSATLSTKVKNPQETKNMPDVALVPSVSLYQWQALGYCQDISAVMDMEVETVAASSGKMKVGDKIDAHVKSFFQVDGKTYALPMQGSATGLLYNRELLRYVNGIDMEGNEIEGLSDAELNAEPQTMKELWDIVEKLENCMKNSNSSAADDVYAFAYPTNATGYFQYFYYSNFAQYLGEETFYSLINLDNMGEQMENDTYKTAYELVMENLSMLGQENNPDRTSDRMFAIRSANDHIYALSALKDSTCLFTPCGDWAYNEMSEISESFAKDGMGLMTIPLICDPDTGLVIAQATPAAEATNAEEYFKIERSRVDASVIPAGEENSDYIYFRKYMYGMATDVFALIPVGANNVEYAKQFMAYMVSDEALDTYSEFTGSKLPYNYQVSDATYAKLSNFQKDSINILQATRPVYTASTNKVVAYGILNMNTLKGLTTSDLYTHLLIWGNEVEPKQIAAEGYLAIKRGIMDKWADRDALVEAYERNPLG